MKASILYTLLFATAITLLVTADYSDTENLNKKTPASAMHSASATQEGSMSFVTFYTPDSTLTVIR